MFFKRRKKEEAERNSKNEATSLRFAEALSAITELNNLITETVVKTQVANTALLLKLKRHLKNSTKSFVSLSDKLKMGVMVLDYKGAVIQSNPKAKEILQCADAECIGSHIFDMISGVRPIDPPGSMLSLIPEFFDNLSDWIFNNSTEETKNSYFTASNVPCTIQPDIEQLVQISSPFLQGEHYMKFTFSVLDNEPEELDDIAYVVIFRPSQPMGEVSLARRKNDVVVKEV